MEKKKKKPHKKTVCIAITKCSLKSEQMTEKSDPSDPAWE